MSRHNQQNPLGAKAVFYRALIMIAATFIVCWYMPRDDRSNYQFDLGKPWRYGQLIATYDFPIYKSDAVIQKEQDSILQFHRPYFSIKNAQSNNEIQRFTATFKRVLSKKMPAYYLPYLESKLQYIYNQGVLSPNDYDQLIKDSISSLRIFKDNEATEVTLKQIFTHKTAYEYLVNPGGDSVRFDRETLRSCNMNDYIISNLSLDKNKTEDARRELLSQLSYAKGMVLSGQKIIDRGDIVNSSTYDILMSLEKEHAKRNDSTMQTHIVWMGQFIYILVIAFCLMLYFYLFRRDYLINTRSILFLTGFPVIFALITSFIVRQNIFTVYIIPYAMAPIFIRVFMDSRTAFITHVSTILICAISLKYPYEFIATELIAGMVAIYSLSELSQRSQLIRSALFITLAMVACYGSLELIHEKDFAQMDRWMYIYIIINGIFLLFAYPLMFLLEKTFSFTSNVTLVELSNINNELLRKMSEVAPGTFQHSLQVANLAAEVANRIGAKAQLARTGALYHDIGKINNPAYFTENQNKINPHDQLTFEQSAAIVISHVKEGLRLAEKHNLPQVIKNFIATHHGTGYTKYFFISCKNANPGIEVDKTIFTYPGPNPFTQEQAILMMADSVEAASRSLNDYTEESISTLVEHIIDAQVKEGYFKKCPITFQDIDIAKEVFKEKLKTIYHTRISYPELKKSGEAK